MTIKDLSGEDKRFLALFVVFVLAFPASVLLCMTAPDNKQGQVAQQTRQGEPGLD